MNWETTRGNFQICNSMWTNSTVIKRPPFVPPLNICRKSKWNTWRKFINSISSISNSNINLTCWRNIKIINHLKDPSTARRKLINWVSKFKIWWHLTPSPAKFSGSARNLNWSAILWRRISRKLNSNCLSPKWNTKILWVRAIGSARSSTMIFDTKSYPYI